MTTYYSYIYVQEKTAAQAIITSSDVALPKPLVGDLISVDAQDKIVSGTITRVVLDLRQDAAGNRTLTYASSVD